MATTVATSTLQSDLEKGQVEPDRTRLTSYVRDITCKVIPFCIGFLIVLSVGAILVITLNFGQVIPSKDLIVVSIMLLVFFILFCLGGMFLYHRKHYPPLTKGPNAPDRPPPKNKTWKDRASIIGTLTVGKFKLGKILHHHRIGSEVRPQGIPNNPTELPSSPSHRGQHAPEQSYNVRPSNTTRNQESPGYGIRDKSQLAQLNKKPIHRVPAPRTPRSNFHAPTGEVIPEAPEEDEQHYVPNDIDTLASQHLNTRNKRGRDVNGDGVSIMSRDSTTHHRDRYSAYSPEIQMTSANRNSQAQSDSQKSPRTPHMPGTRTSRAFPVDALQPSPRQVRLNRHSTEPLANLVLIPGDINDRQFAEFPDNFLYIINNQLSEPDDEPMAAKSRCECKCKYYGRNKPRSKVHEQKKDENQNHINAPKDLGIETTASKVPKAQESPSVGSLPDENDRSGTTHPSLTSRSRAEPRRHEDSKKGHKTSFQKRDNRSRALDGHRALPDYPASPELPSLPPRTKPPPNRRDPDPDPSKTLEDWRGLGYDAFLDYVHQKEEAGGKSLSRSWGQQQVPGKRGRRANRMTEGHASKEHPPKPSEKEGFDINPRTRYHDHYPCQTPWVPPRASSRGFSDVYGTASRTASRSSSSISSDYRQYE